MDLANRIICGDCLGVMKDWPDNCVDLVLTDPPYGLTQNKWDSVIPLNIMWKFLMRISKPNTAIVLTASQPFTTTLIASNKKMFRYEWIWDKKLISNPMNAKIMPLKQHENIVVFYEKPPTYNPQPYQKTTRGLMSWKNVEKTHKSETYGVTDITQSKNENVFGYPRSLLSQIPVMNNLGEDKKGSHPTQKPVALMKYLIKTYSHKDNIVLDFACGSGTTCVAAKMLGRRFIGIDISPEYCEIARMRLKAVETGVPVAEQKQGQMGLFE